MIRKQAFLWLFMSLLLAGLLAACGGDDPTPEPDFPTLAPTFDPAAGAAADAGAEAELTPDFFDQTAEANSEDSGPPIDGPPVGDPPLSGPGDQPMAIETLSATDAISDFSGLSVGQGVRLVGELRIDEATQELVLVDANGLSLSVTHDMPSFMIESMLNTQVDLPGVLVDDGAGGLMLNAVAVAPGGGTSAGQGDFDPSDDQDLPFVDDGAGATNGFGTFSDVPDREVILLEITLPENMSALQAHDALLAELGDTLGDASLMEIIGSSELGWSFRFDFAEEGQTVSYNVLADGSVAQLANIDMSAMPTLNLSPIARDEVVVDSDVAEPQLRQGLVDVPPNYLPLITLRTAADGSVVWSLEGVPDLQVDAQQAP